MTTLTLAELKKQAQKILDIPDEIGDFKNHTFETSSGRLINQCNIAEVHRSAQEHYETSVCGTAYIRTVTVLCKKTESKDREGRDIYITPDEIVFVYDYYGGCPSSFDEGVLMPPEF